MGPQTHPFSPIEVRLKVKNFDNTAPGPDRLTYKHWQGVDPDGKALAAIFNICFKARRSPSVWKETHTIFIPKKGDPSSPSSWRPIELCLIISKIYSGLITKRLNAWIEQQSILSSAQKGFRLFDGCFEHAYIVEERIRRARINHSPLYLLSVDVTNAFGSVCHSALRPALLAQHVGEWYTDVISDMYNGAYTRLLTTEGLSDSIEVNIGVKQGSL